MSTDVQTCDGTGGDPSLAMRLPVLGGGDPGKIKIRRSKSGPWRAAVLVTVQLLMIVHIVQWAITGTTISPVEPSESMEFVKEGVINAGLIFFAAALLATLLLGRWFCGWACHVVLLQDLCGWLMKKVGVRPRPFRSRLLMWVPLILAVYMFLWPLAYRLLIAPHTAPELRWPGFESHLTTDDFWRTFAGVGVAIPFLLICGFATVYFLGSKGFCTYGCPYGGFFAPLDKLAVGSIRVTDACEGCSHCTAVCTSNVRVHEEVREYGMVVDQGCMKCLDCVSVCPNDALYYGLGRPAVLKGPPASRRPKAHFDLTWPEELLFAGIFAGSFFAVRSVYGLVPMLMAAGTAGCVTFIMWKAWKMLRDENVSFHRYRLRFRGRLQPAGWTWAALTLLLGVLVVHSGAVRATLAAAERYEARAARPAEEVFTTIPQPMPLEMRADAETALRLYSLVSEIGAGGFSLPMGWQDELDIRIARLHTAMLDFEAAEDVLRRSLERDGRSERFAASLAWVLRARGRDDEAVRLYRETLLEEAEYHDMLADFVTWSPQIGTEAVLALCAERDARFPDDLPTVRWLAVLRLRSGAVDEGIEDIRRAISLDPTDPDAWRTLAGALSVQERHDEAIGALEEALRLRPEDPNIYYQKAEMLLRAGRREEALEAKRKEMEMREEQR